MKIYDLKLYNLHVHVCCTNILGIHVISSTCFETNYMYQQGQKLQFGKCPTVYLLLKNIINSNHPCTCTGTSSNYMYGTCISISMCFMYTQ